jgi:hypothetical protein
MTNVPKVTLAVFAACLLSFVGSLAGSELTISYGKSAKDPTVYTSVTVEYEEEGVRSSHAWKASGYVERPRIQASPDRKLLAVTDRAVVEVYEVNSHLIGSLKSRKPLASYDLMTLEGESFVSKFGVSFTWLSPRVFSWTLAETRTNENCELVGGLDQDAFWVTAQGFAEGRRNGQRLHVYVVSKPFIEKYKSRGDELGIAKFSDTGAIEQRARAQAELNNLKQAVKDLKNKLERQ